MKTATCFLCLWCLTNVCMGQEAEKTRPPPLFRERRISGTKDDELLVVQNRVAIAHARAEEVASMKNVVFSEESVSVSETTDWLLFEHEENVNRFLSTPGKFGLNRWIVIHMSNPRLATHGGVARFPAFDTDGWNAGGQLYELTRPCGMIGDLDHKQPKAYLFRPSPYMREHDKKDEAAREEPKVEESELNRFEEHAVAMLRQGETLVRWENDRTMHAVGAVRAETQCLRCHEGSKPGDLLGAFTYSFAKSEAEPQDEQTRQILKLHDERKTPLEIAEAVGLLKKPASAANPREKSGASVTVRITLVSRGIVTAEMLAEQAQRRKDLLNSDLGPVKKPKASAGAE